MADDYDAREFIGKYDDVDLETGVENVERRLDRDFRTSKQLRSVETEQLTRPEQ